MTHKIYALLVGIDEYPEQISNLKGCLNDTAALSAYLNSRVASETHKVHTQILLNQEASREAIITQFQTHLSQATEGDVALFAFSGHGSQEPAPPEYWTIEPDRLNETLVCWDSRQTDGKDLSDKELAQLIAAVAKQGAQVTVILDCCHSGSGTRDLGRFLPPDTRHHSFDSYLIADGIDRPAARERRLSTPATLHIVSRGAPQEIVPQGRHILLAACRDQEVAKEVSIDGQTRGALSYHLLKTLYQAGRPLSYHELYQRVYARMKGLQSPQLETTDPDDTNRLFLGQTSFARVPYFTVTYERACKDWFINGGAVHGIPAVTTAETTKLAIYPFESFESSESLKSLPAAQNVRANAMGKAEVIEVFPQKSRIKFLQLTGVEALRSDLAFKAVVTDLARASIGVELSGDEAGLERIRQVIGLEGVYIREAMGAGHGRVRVMACDRTYSLTSINSDRPLTRPVPNYTDESAQQILHSLEHIARWFHILDLTNPSVEKIATEAIKLQIFQQNVDSEKVLHKAPMRLEYQYHEGHWHQPQIRVKLTNQSEQPLYCALLGLAENYEISAGWFEAGGVWLHPGEEAWALAGKPIYLKVPKSLWQQGVTEFRDILKLIVSTAEFDARLLEQGKFGASVPAETRIYRPDKSGSALDRLLNGAGKRTRSNQQETESYDDWLTNQWEILTVRSLP